MDKVIVLNRKNAINLTRFDASLDRVIVSISSLGDNPPEFYGHNYSIREILFVYFDDEEEGVTAISDRDAEKIARFVNKWYHKVDQIVVHCDAGISRSAGVAAAILKHYENDETLFFDNPKYCPNMRCFRKVKERLEAYNG